VASSGALATTADEGQYAVGEGPCLDAARSASPVLVLDQEAESRWPSYLPVALSAGVRASLSVPVDVPKGAGALNLYSRQANAFDDDVVAVAYDLAQYVGVVVNAADEWQRATALADQLKQALESRAVIEQAKGILMAERRCTPDEAFQRLVRLSQESHRKLRDVAHALVKQTVNR
jgi:GAF domain-containing protein